MVILRDRNFFLIFLSQLGCDILYINPHKDILDLYPECSRFSTLVEFSKSPTMLDIPLEKLNTDINKNINNNKTYTPINKPQSEQTSVDTNFTSTKIKR